MVLPVDILNVFLLTQLTMLVLAPTINYSLFSPHQYMFFTYTDSLDLLSTDLLKPYELVTVLINLLYIFIMLLQVLHALQLLTIVVTVLHINILIQINYRLLIPVHIHLQLCVLTIIVITLHQILIELKNVEVLTA